MHRYYEFDYLLGVGRSDDDDVAVLELSLAAIPPFADCRPFDDSAAHAVSADEEKGAVAPFYLEVFAGDVAPSPRNR